MRASILAILILGGIVLNIKAQFSYNEKGQAIPPASQPFGKEAFEPTGHTVIRWLGNAGFLINSRGTCLMVDPMLRGFDMPLLINMPIAPKDVPHLDAVLITHCAKAHKSFRGFDRLAEAALLEYPWPGNIRELKNVIGRAVLICQEQWISVSDLNLEISLPKEEETQWTEEEKEKALLLQTLEKTGDNRSKAARLLNVSRTTLYEKLRKYHIID